jgi:hypothetical protein
MGSAVLDYIGGAIDVRRSFHLSASAACRGDDSTPVLNLTR